MTDLEDLWGRMPTGQPPTARILQQGRMRSTPWRSVRRPVATVGALAALGGAFVAGTLTSGTSTTDTPTPPGARPGLPAAVAASPVAFHADLSPAQSCDALLETYVDRALGKVTAWGWHTPDIWIRDLYSAYDAGRAQLTETKGTLSTERVTSSETGTNVQEEQVDEPDTVKTDGELLARLRGDELLIYDVAGPRVRELSALQLTGIDDAQILLSGDTVVALGVDRQSPRSDLTGAHLGTRVQTISIADPRDPQVTDDITYGAAVESARQQGDTVRMVLSAGLPDLPFVHPGRHRPGGAALAQNRRIVERSTLQDWLPGYDTGDGPQRLLDCRNVAVPPSEVGLDTVAVVTFASGAPDAPQAFGLAGATSIAYESTDHLYLASTPRTSWGCFDCTGRGEDGGTSHLFQFDLEEDRAVHVASGEVEGTIRDRWALDESGGELRVLVGPSSETGDFNSIVTFERRRDDLVETGRLDDLGPREDIKSVRWQDELALVVTYRQVDPLYVVDLRQEPRVVSELRVPGFSSYLHPLGSRRLVGVGSGPADNGWGAQLGLFRTRDLTQVAPLDTWHYAAGTQPVAASDPRAFTWLPRHRALLTVIRDGRIGWLSVQHLSGGRLDNRMVEVEYGDDINQVRTFGMPDGRVVLVTGEDVRFLSL